MKKIYLLLTLSLIMLSYSGFSQSGDNETSASVQIRPRGEYRNGALFPRIEDELPAAFITNRARLSLGYSRNNLEIGMSAQHVGVWGQDPQVDRNGRFILNEAWAKMIFFESFFIKLGRQGLVYDDERILGGLDWNVAGRFHDALNLGYEGRSNKVHLILAYNQNDEKVIGGSYYAPGGQPYKTMQTLWYQYNNKDFPFLLSALFMNLGRETGTSNDPETKYLQTMGVNLGYSPSIWKFGASFYYQVGKTLSDSKVSAWMLSLNAMCNLTGNLGLKIGSDYLSGDDSGSDKYEAFDPLYGTHHKFYGSMDYFYASSFINGYNPGLWDNYLGVTYKAGGRLNLSLNYHYFLINNDIPDNQDISKGLGSEIDFQLDWSIMKDVSFSAGYSTMLGTGSMDIVKGGDHTRWQDWAWVSLNINPQIFFAKW